MVGCFRFQEETGSILVAAIRDKLDAAAIEKSIDAATAAFTERTGLEVSSIDVNMLGYGIFRVDVSVVVKEPVLTDHGTEERPIGILSDEGFVALER